MMHVLALAFVPVLALAGGTGSGKASSGQKKSGSSARAPQGPDVFGGYSYTHAGEASLHGWQLTATFPFRGSLRWEADLAGHYGSFAGADLSQVTLFGGARYALARPRVSPFGHLLLGLVRRTSSVPGVSEGSAETDWGGALGGGADVRINRRWAVRAQADLLFLQGLDQWDADPRLSLGAVYRFGR